MSHGTPCGVGGVGARVAVCDEGGVMTVFTADGSDTAAKETSGAAA